MKKLKLVAALLAAAPLLSHADATIYGSIRTGMDWFKDAHTNQSSMGVDDYSSRIGFKGNEDLGSGLKAIWQVENGFDSSGKGGTGSASGTFANRTTFVGLQGDFGKVRLGYLDDVTSETEATDIWYDARRSGLAFPLYEGNDLIGAFGDGRFKNSIRYDTPDLAGFSGILQYGFDETAPAGQPKAGQWGARLAYTYSGFFGAYAYQAKFNQGSNHGQTASINRIEGGYDANNLYLAATYNWNKSFGDATGLGIGSTDTAAELKSETWAVTASYDIGAFKPKLTYSQYKSPKVDGQEVDWGRKQVAVGLDYSLSKRTLLGVQYAQIKNDHGYQVANGDKGDKSSSAGVYLKHNF
ncbi:porin [Crenobacter sp. SG2303]|uniref:Porin n=1 Tax=Crenobacter oryzisoli TaxID=3056844 RepID=A0ABT7XNV3_9NEIS|nr:porin [Crenobacter sp. SG2303]MDN0075477.1 porin [Crenobacter sp. SG2303]